MTSSPPPPSSPATFQQRVDDVLLAIYRHPLTIRQLLRLNPTFRHPFPIETIHEGHRTSRESRTLRRLLARACSDGLVGRSHYATAGRGALPYFHLLEAGYERLFPGHAVPKRAYTSGRTHERRSRRNPFFLPISLGRQVHEQAVAETVVHTLVQAHRDGLGIGSLHTRNRVRLDIQARYAMTTELRTMVRLDRQSGAPAKEHISLYPDLTIDLTTPDGSQFLRFFELDGSTESVLTTEDVESITRKVRFYDHFADQCPRRFRVCFVTYKPNSFKRLESIRECVRTVVRNAGRPLFLFATLERFLAENGVLTRARFLDEKGEPAACVRPSAPLASAACPQIARGLAHAGRPQPFSPAQRSVRPDLPASAAAAR